MAVSRDSMTKQGRRIYAAVDRGSVASQSDTLIRETVPVGEWHRDRSEREKASAHRRAGGFGSAVRVLFGFIWLADVYFKWQPSFLQGLPDVIQNGSVGQPGWLMPWFTFVRAVIATQPAFWAYGIAVVETGIALALILGF